MKHNQDSELRPNPDALLKEIQKEEGKPGKLKIFLGYSPGWARLMRCSLRRIP